MNTAPGTPTGFDRWWFKEALIIALVTIIGSWYVLFFEAGYLGYFHIPYYFVSLSPSIIVGTSLIWAILLIGLCVLGITLSLGTSVLVSLVERWKKKRIERDEVREPLVLKLVLGGGLLVFFFVILVTLGAGLFFCLGSKHAKSLDEFPVFKPTSLDSFDSEVAVIRAYGEHLYAVPFDKKTTKTDPSSGHKITEFEKQLIIMKMSEIKTPLSSKKIGRLQLKK